MKPNFALNFTSDAIVLLHRTPRGWMSIGEAALDSADLAETLGYLQSLARDLSPQGVATKLILPNDQVLYTEIDAPGPDSAARRRQVAAALEGRTPYAVDELAFDIWGKGPRVQVAVVAKETLDQAESFADQHRFNPVCCVAIPAAGAFGGEPFFGQTSAAARLLAPGESVARDQDPVHVISRDGGREARRDEAADAAKPATSRTEAARAARAAARAAAAAEAAARRSEPPPVAPGADLSPPTVEMRPAQRSDEVIPERPVAEVVETATAPAVARPQDATVMPTPVPAVSVPPPTPEPAPAPQAKAPAPPPETVETAPEPVPTFSSRRRDDPARTAAPDAPAELARTARPPTAPAVAQADALAPSRSAATFAAPPQPSVAVPPPAPAAGDIARQPPPLRSTAPPEGSRQATVPASATGVPPMPRPAPDPVDRAVTAAAPAAVPPAVAVADAASTVRLAPDAVVAPRGAAPSVAVPPTIDDPGTGAPPPLAAARPAPVRPGTAGPAAPVPGTAAPGKPAVAGAASRLLSGAAMVTAATVPGKRMAKPQVAKRPDSALRPGAAATSGGGLSGAASAARPRGKPRYLGLALTGILLIFLVIVAAWSSIYLSRDTTAPADDTAVAAADPVGTTPDAPAPVIVDAGSAAEPDPELLADLAEADVGPVSGDAVDPAATVQTTAEADQPPEPVADPIVEAAPETAAALPAQPAQDSGAGLSTSGATTGQDEIFLSSVDAPPPAFDAVAMPAPVAAPDAAPEATAPPPPFGAVYQFDETGRIIAGATGVVAPGGFWLIAARPPLIPPARPAPTVEAAAPDAASQTPPTDTVTVATSGFQPDPAVADRRPRLRPEGLTPPVPDPAADQGTAPADAADPQQADDDAALPPGDPRYAALRPRARSAAVLNRAEENALAAASLVTAAAPVEASPAANLPVPLSRRPAPRPRDFSRSVAAAVAAATQPEPRVRPEPEPEEPAASPEVEPEPEVVATAAPRIPTRANVAKQATFANAINLSKVNLIGIYGTASNRYAMVRTAGGRFTKVRVGDRVDGGTVAAITGSELRYKKGGRMLALAMPRS